MTPTATLTRLERHAPYAPRATVVCSRASHAARLRLTLEHLLLVWCVPASCVRACLVIVIDIAIERYNTNTYVHYVYLLIHAI